MDDDSEEGEEKSIRKMLLEVGKILILPAIIPVTFTFGKDRIEKKIDNAYESERELKEKESVEPHAAAQPLQKTGTRYTAYNIYLTPEKSSDIIVQAYIEIDYAGLKVGTVLVEDLYEQNAMHSADGNFTLIREEGVMECFCSNLEQELVEKCGIEEDKLEVKEDMIVCFQYPNGEEQAEIPVYYTFNDMNMLVLTRDDALDRINDTKTNCLLAKVNIHNISENEYAEIVSEVKDGLNV